MEENKLNEIKSLFERHLTKDKKFNWTTCLNEIEAKFETLQMRIDNLDKGMRFFVDWFEQEQNKKTKLILPDSVISNITNKDILDDYKIL